MLLLYSSRYSFFHSPLVALLGGLMHALCKLYGVLMLITRFVLCWHLWLSLAAAVGGDIITLDAHPPTSPL